MVPRVPDEAGNNEDEARHIHGTLFYPGMYSPSGFDLMKILYQVATRPNPTIDLGPVDASCPIVLCDIRLADAPVVYATESFLALTGYSLGEVIGRNCRFLQQPPPSTLSSPSSSRERRILHDSIARNEEVQVAITNFRKDGTLWTNFLSVVPVCCDDDGDDDGDGDERDDKDRRFHCRYRYSVGFVCDISAKKR